MDTNRLLTPPEYTKLKSLFDSCDFAHPDDLQLFEQGNHRNLYSYLCSLGFRPYPGRGTAYAFAETILSENEKHYKSIILGIIQEHGDFELTEYCKLFLNLQGTL